MKIDSYSNKNTFTGAFRLQLESEADFKIAQKFLTIDLSAGQKWKEWGVRQVYRMGHGSDKPSDLVVITTKKKDAFMKKLIKEYGLSFDFFDSMPRSKSELRDAIKHIVLKEPIDK